MEQGKNNAEQWTSINIPLKLLDYKIKFSEFLGKLSCHLQKKRKIDWYWTFQQQATK